MNNLPQIVNTAAMLTFLGGGSADRADLDAALGVAPILVAADGGANTAFDWGVTPAAVVGDLDSVNTEQARGLGVPLVFVEDQNSTDLEKCLVATRAQVVLGIGFLGGRLDHELASMNALCRAKDRAVVLLGAEDVVFRMPHELSLTMQARERVSLFPMSDVDAESDGLEWALDGLSFRPNGQNGCSNRATGGTASLRILSGDMLMILSKARFFDAVDALCRAYGISRQEG